MGVVFLFFYEVLLIFALAFHCFTRGLSEKSMFFYRDLERQVSQQRAIFEMFMSTCDMYIKG